MQPGKRRHQGTLSCFLTLIYVTNPAAQAQGSCCSSKRARLRVRGRAGANFFFFCPSLPRRADPLSVAFPPLLSGATFDASQEILSFTLEP